MDVVKCRFIVCDPANHDTLARRNVINEQRVWWQGMLIGGTYLRVLSSYKIIVTQYYKFLLQEKYVKKWAKTGTSSTDFLLNSILVNCAAYNNNFHFISSRSLRRNKKVIKWANQLRHARLSVHLSTWKNLRTPKRALIKFYIGEFYENV